jgi:hypothetical protein
VEQVSKFELVLNASNAQALGLAIRPSLLFGLWAKGDDW